jgi:Uma2 family endonuclease
MPSTIEASNAPFTARDYRLMEDDGCRYEVIQGELLMAPAPNRFHQGISRNLCQFLYSYLRKKKIGKAYDAPFDVYLDDFNVVQPDVVFVAAGSACKLIPEGAEGAPDLLVEILSPSTSKRDLRDKRALYAEKGVKEFWVVSPETRQVQVYFLEKQVERPSLVLEEIDTLRSDMFPGLEIPVGELFED